MDPTWDFRDNTGEGQFSHLRNMILKGIQAAAGNLLIGVRAKKSPRNLRRIPLLSQRDLRNAHTLTAIEIQNL